MARASRTCSSGEAWAETATAISDLDCAYCWVKNVESAWSIGSNIGLYETFRNVVRDSFVHETPIPNPGGGGYLTRSPMAALRKPNREQYLLVRQQGRTRCAATGGGNVFAYNYTDDAFGTQYPDQPEAGINAGHYTTPHLELLEGNYSQNFKGDSFWGNSIYITAFRNWFSGCAPRTRP